MHYANICTLLGPICTKSLANVVIQRYDCDHATWSRLCRTQNTHDNIYNENISYNYGIMSKATRTVRNTNLALTYTHIDGAHRRRQTLWNIHVQRQNEIMTLRKTRDGIIVTTYTLSIPVQDTQLFTMRNNIYEFTITILLSLLIYLQIKSANMRMFGFASQSSITQLC